MRNGKDYEKVAANPFFVKFGPFGPPTHDLRTLFYNEIEDALKRRKEQDELMD